MNRSAPNPNAAAHHIPCQAIWPVCSGFPDPLAFPQRVVTAERKPIPKLVITNIPSPAGVSAANSGTPSFPTIQASVSCMPASTKLVAMRGSARTTSSLRGWGGVDFKLLASAYAFGFVRGSVMVIASSARFC